MKRPRWVQVTFALLLGAGAVVACSVDDASMASGVCTGLSCNRSNLETTNTQDLPGSLANAPDASEPVTSTPVKDACGVGSCLPDDGDSCGTAGPGAGGGTGAGEDASADAGADAGAGGDELLDAGLDGGTREPPVDGSFSLPPPATPEPSTFSCQLSLDPNQRVERRCAPAGSQDIDEACTSSLDCKPGLGCVGMVRAGRCLPYCCGIEDADACGRGYYCAQRPLRSPELGEADGPLVPVCDRADNCSLGEPVNCAGEHCVCEPGFACTVVRADGTTACLPEGPGEAGDPCPCKWGFHCSQATDPPTCVKICGLSSKENDCGPGVCQATPLLPQGWGTCVGQMMP